MIIFIPLSEKINYFILFIIIILTHNYLLNTPASFLSPQAAVGGVFGIRNIHGSLCRHRLR